MNFDSRLTTLVLFNNAHCVAISKADVVVVLLLVILNRDVLFQEHWLTDTFLCENKQHKEQEQDTVLCIFIYLFYFIFIFTLY